MTTLPAIDPSSWRTVFGTNCLAPWIVLLCAGPAPSSPAGTTISISGRLSSQDFSARFGTQRLPIAGFFLFLSFFSSMPLASPFLGGHLHCIFTINLPTENSFAQYKICGCGGLWCVVESVDMKVFFCGMCSAASVDP